MFASYCFKLRFTRSGYFTSVYSIFNEVRLSVDRAKKKLLYEFRRLKRIFCVQPLCSHLLNTIWRIIIILFLFFLFFIFCVFCDWYRILICVSRALIGANTDGRRETKRTAPPEKLTRRCYGCRCWNRPARNSTISPSWSNKTRWRTIIIRFPKTKK